MIRGGQDAAQPLGLQVVYELWTGGKSLFLPGSDKPCFLEKPICGGLADRETTMVAEVAGHLPGRPFGVEQGYFKHPVPLPAKADSRYGPCKAIGQAALQIPAS